MRVDSKHTANLITVDSRKITDATSSTSKKKVNFNNRNIHNGYLTITTRELNNKIGILQIAYKTIKDILNSDSITEIKTKLLDAKLFNKQIFTQSQIIKDFNGNTIFDASRILDIIPDDDRDIAIFKKYLKIESKFIEDSIKILKEESMQDSIKIEDNKLDKDFLMSNPLLFAKSHNVASLASKIDTLLL